MKEILSISDVSSVELVGNGGIKEQIARMRAQADLREKLWEVLSSPSY